MDLIKGLFKLAVKVSSVEIPDKAFYLKKFYRIYDLPYYDKDTPVRHWIRRVQVDKTGCNYIKRILLPPYSSKFSKKKYKQYQLFVILLYKVWVNVSYRDIIEVISSNPSFDALLSLSDIPHFTTIQKFCKRISMKPITSVFNKVVKSFHGMLGNIMIIDSTGFSVTYHSFYYDKRLNDFGKRVRKKYVGKQYLLMKITDGGCI